MLKRRLKNLLSDNKTKKVIQTLLSITSVVNDNDSLFDQAILVSAQYKNYSNQKTLGLLSFDQQNLSSNQINFALLQIINSLPDSVEATNSQKVLNKGNKIIELLIDGKFDDFNSIRKEDLVKAISVILNIERKEVIIRELNSGSVKMYIEMPKFKAFELINIFKESTNNDLLKGLLKIKKITLKEWWLTSPFILKKILPFLLICSLIFFFNKITELVISGQEPNAIKLTNDSTRVITSPKNLNIMNSDSASLSNSTNKSHSVKNKTNPVDSTDRDNPLDKKTSTDTIPELVINIDTNEVDPNISKVHPVFFYSTSAYYAIFGNKDLRLYGKVFNFLDSLPLKDVKVIVNGTTLITDEEGKFALTINPEPGYDVALPPKNISFHRTGFKNLEIDKISYNRLTFSATASRLVRSNFLSIIVYLQQVKKE